MLHCPGTADILHCPGKADMLHCPGTTDLLHYPGTTDMFHCPGKADMLHCLGTADTHCPGTEDMLHCPGTAIITVSFFHDTRTSFPIITSLIYICMFKILLINYITLYTFNIGTFYLLALLVLKF